MKAMTAAKIFGNAWVRPISLGVLLLAISACSSIEPWVKPYERGYLADPIMAFERDTTSGKYMAHVYEAREAARGAEGSAGGGCGCN